MRLIVAILLGSLVGVAILSAMVLMLIAVFALGFWAFGPIGGGIALIILVGAFVGGVIAYLEED